MRLFDTHAHINDPRFDTCREEVMSRAREAGLIGIMAIGTDLPTSEKCCDLALQFEDVHAVVGIQPNYVGDAEADHWDRVVSLAERPEVKALGETGLDCYWEDNPPLDQQQDYFDRHLRLSQSSGLPFVVHMRESGEEVYAMLEEAAQRAPLSGIMHSFTGDWSLAERCLNLGMHISFAGMVTFKRSDDLRSVAARVPMDRILIETDSPYLTPHPHRGKRPCEPHYVQHTAQCIADAREMEAADFAEQTTRNALKLFGLE